MKKVIKNANIITMTSKKILYQYDLLIENGVIKGIEQNIDISYADTIDCTDKYVLPGLFDMHVHLDEPVMLGLLLANGITSVRNMWGSSRILQWKRAIEKDELTGPRIYTTNPMTDGARTWEGCSVVATPAEAERAVLKAIEAGYDYFKSFPNIKKDVFVKLMETANRYGLKVVGHGNNNVTVNQLIGLGYYSLEHISFLPENDDEIVALAKSGMWFTPTHLVIEKVNEHVCKKKPLFPCLHEEYIGDKCKKAWEQATNIRRNEPRYKKFYLQDFIRRGKTFMAHSDKILLGTDTANPGVVPGFSLHEELRKMVNNYGLEPYKALRMGTVNAALNLGIEGIFGTIEVNKAADLLILEENPLTAIENTNKIYAVIRAGQLFNKSALEEILEDCKKQIKLDSVNAIT